MACAKATPPVRAVHDETAVPVLRPISAATHRLVNPYTASGVAAPEVWKTKPVPPVSDVPSVAACVGAAVAPVVTVVVHTAVAASLPVVVPADTTVLARAANVAPLWVNVPDAVVVVLGKWSPSRTASPVVEAVDAPLTVYAVPVVALLAVTDVGEYSTSLAPGRTVTAHPAIELLAVDAAVTVGIVHTPS